MTQNNDSNNGAEGDEQRPCQTPAGDVDIPSPYRGRYTFVRRSEAVPRTDDTMGLAGNTDHCQRMYTNRRLPLDFPIDDEDEEDEEETPPANNGQENRESAPNQQDALMGGQPWSEQIPSQDHFRCPPFLGSYNDCSD